MMRFRGAALQITTTEQASPERGGVLLVVHGFPPEACAGVENYTYNLAQALTRLGVRSAVLYPVLSQNPTYEFRRDSYHGIELFKFSVPEGNHLTWLDSPPIEAAFAAFLQRQGFQLVHFQHTYHLSFSMLEVARGAGVPVALTLHDFWFICPRIHLFIEETETVCSGFEKAANCVHCLRNHAIPTPADRFLQLRHDYVKELLLKADLVLSPSKFLADVFQRHGLAAGRIAVTPLGVLPFRPLPRKSGGTLTFGYIGTIHPIKNVYRMVSSFAASSGPARLVLYGSGEPRHLEQLEHLVGDDPRIQLHGAYRPEQLPAILSEIDVLVVPSLIESYCLTVREGLRAGLPVVAAEVGGIPEIVEHGVNGFLFDPADGMALTSQLQAIIDRPSLVHSLRPDGRPIITIDEEATSLAGRYREMIHSRAERKPSLARTRPTPGQQGQKPLKVAVFSKDNYQHACPQIRLILPLIAPGSDFSLVWFVAANDTDLTLAANAEILEQCDLFVVQRLFPCEQTRSALDQLATLGKPIVYDTDDLLTEIPVSHPHRQLIERHALHILDFIPRCQMVTVSTEAIRQRILPLNPNVTVLPNLLDQGLWSSESPKSAGPLVIGYCGTNTHAKDLGVIEAVLSRIAAKYPGRVAFTFMGCATERLSQLPGFSYIPFESSYLSYAKKLQQVPLDIALVPLENNRFNRCKSNIKWLEYSICGIAGVYADLPPYNGCIEHGRTGLLVGESPEQWFEAIDLLIGHPTLRQDIARAARREVLSHYTVQTEAYRLRDTFQALLAQQGPPAVSIVIPLFNKVELTRHCLEQLAQCTDPALYELILVDNGSSDGTAAYLETLHPGVKLVRNEANLGFAKACNQGAARARGRYLLFLNNDTEPRPGWLEPLVATLDRDPQVAAAGSKLLFPDGTIQHAGVILAKDHTSGDPLVALHIYYQKPASHPEANVPFCYQALTAACLAVRREAFHGAGGFDEGYWNGYEDVDLCLKLAATGAKLVYQPESVLVHFESQSGPQRFTKVKENVRRLHQKWLGKVSLDLEIAADGTLTVGPGRPVPYHPGAPRGRSPKVSVVIPVFNQLSYTRQCLEALFAVTGEGIPFEVIVVDNASSDGSSEYLKSLEPRIRVLTNAQNLGFAKACNQGARAAQGEFLLFLNNDTVPKPGWLSALLKGAEMDGADLVGAKLLYPDGRVQHAGVAFADPGDGVHVFKGMPGDHPAANRKRFMQCVTGACLLLARRLFQELGGFDEGFVNGYEDVDLCLRAREAGKRVLYTPESVLIHFEETSAGRKEKDRLNAQRFFGRWGGRIRFDDLELYEAEGLLAPIGDEHADRLYGLLGANDNAFFIYLNVLSRHPQDAGALLNLGRACAANGRRDDAQLFLERLLELRQGHPAALGELARITAQRNG